MDGVTLHLLCVDLQSVTVPSSFSSGDYSFVREEPLPHPLQELHVDVCAEGQPGGQLHDDHDCHHVSGQEEPGCKATLRH